VNERIDVMCDAINNNCRNIINRSKKPVASLFAATSGQFIQWIVDNIRQWTIKLLEAMLIFETTILKVGTCKSFSTSLTHAS